MTAKLLARVDRSRLVAEISLWSADLARLADDIARVEPFADIYHIDAADGHFSPAFLLFPDQVSAIRKLTQKPLHVHLMVSDSVLLDQVTQFSDAGADLISIHAENANADQALSMIMKRGLAGGVVLQLHTPVTSASRFLDRIAMLTLLGTRIGIKGQGLDEQAVPRLAEAKAMIKAQGRDVILAADGGIRENTVPELYSAGADTVVMGSLCFGAADLSARMAWIHGHRDRA
jgi:ribulose-phosphate 3-epimerase